MTGTDRPGRRLARGDRVAIATHNPGKLAEFERLLAPHGVHVASASALGLAEPDETAPDLPGNAALKARSAAAAAAMPALADDSGFGIVSLGGAPGVLSARYAGPARDFADAMRRLHAAAAAHSDRGAFFACALCLAWPDGDTVSVEGRVDGVWVWPPRGSGGFGYDPMFQPDGETRTFAEMEPAAKASIGHRGRALALLAARCLPRP